MTHQPAHPLHAAALLLLGTGAARFLTGQTAALRHPAEPTFDALLTAAAGWLLLVTVGWTVLVCAAAVLETTTDGRLRATAWVCPARARQVLLPALGLVLATGVAAPTWGTARSGRDDPEPAPATAGGTTAEALPTPARPVDRPRAAVVVRPGDTLWGLSADRLAPHAPDAVVARSVIRTHRLNRSLVGPDPDLIRPGQRLLLPRLSSLRPAPDRQPHEEKP